MTIHPEGRPCCITSCLARADLTEVLLLLSFSGYVAPQHDEHAVLGV